MKRTRRAALALGALAVVVLAGACGTTEQPTASSSGKGSTSTKATKGAKGTKGSGDTAQPVSVTDARGKDVRLDKPAKRVVALEWGEAEMLVTLGVMPVGVADVQGYTTWDTAEKLAPTVKDVGTRAEPSVDAVVRLNPDLVVMEQQRDSRLVGQLEKYVPVIVTKGSDAKDNLARMRTDFTTIATAVGRKPQAAKALAGFDSAVADAKRKLAAAGDAGTPFVMADATQQGSTIAIRPFGQGALVSQVAIAAGLSNAWHGKADPVWGLGQTDVEGLTALKDPKVRFLYNASDGKDVFAGGLASSPIWRALPFVKAGHVHRLTNGIWTFGGPASCEQYLRELVRVLTT